MSIIVNGTTIPTSKGKIVVNGVQITEVKCNGTSVWKSSATPITKTYSYTDNSSDDQEYRTYSSTLDTVSLSGHTKLTISASVKTASWNSWDVNGDNANVVVDGTVYSLYKRTQWDGTSQGSTYTKTLEINISGKSSVTIGVSGGDIGSTHTITTSLTCTFT